MSVEETHAIPGVSLRVPTFRMEQGGVYGWNMGFESGFKQHDLPVQILSIVQPKRFSLSRFVKIEFQPLNENSAPVDRRGAYIEPEEYNIDRSGLYIPERSGNKSRPVVLPSGEVAVDGLIEGYFTPLKSTSN